MCCSDSEVENFVPRLYCYYNVYNIVHSLYRSGDSEGLHCVQCHPTHPHLAVTGRTDGSVCFWDLRHHRQPLSHMAAHTDIGVCVSLCVFMSVFVCFGVFVCVCACLFVGMCVCMCICV